MAVTAGATFTYVPTWVFPEEREFHTIITQAESMKKEYYNMSGASSVDRYKCVFSGVTDTTYDGGTGILDHFIGQSAGYQSFKFSSMPSYVLNGSSVTGRWVAGTLKETPLANAWNLELVFEHDKSLN